MSAERLRLAAEKLREVAGEADEGPWEYDGQVISSDWPGGSVAQTGLFENGVYIALVSPPVAMVAAKLLMTIAAHVSTHECEAHCEPGGCDQVLAADALADAILGDDR